MLGSEALRGAARALYRVGMGLGSVVVFATLSHVGLSLSKAVLVAIYGLALVGFVAVAWVRPDRRIGGLLVVAAVVGSFGGLTLVIAPHVLDVGGEAAAWVGGAVLPIGGAAAGAVAVNDPGGAHGARARLRQLGLGLGLLASAILVVLRWPAVDWLTMVSWGLPALVLATGALTSAARVLEKRS